MLPRIPNLINRVTDRINEIVCDWRDSLWYDPLKPRDEIFRQRTPGETVQNIGQVAIKAPDQTKN